MAEHKYTIPRLISLLYRSGHMYIAGRLKEREIGRGQYIFLNALYKGDGLSQEELAEYLMIDKGTTAKALKKLEEQGYVVRKARESDKRFNRVFLTPKALEIKDEVRGVLSDWRSLLTEGLSENDKELVWTLLERMGENAARLAKEASPPDGPAPEPKSKEGEPS
ncbi:DNA-binding transcriptional regulator, MarR family [Paenibacillus sp. UNCCL117]|uniref:MarR family winged helix-turn-helix transcriptional regulator n=1 Tax=unclassified Paenibacillus TaxID=185978 RepID=UPI00088AB821|nr:MULTISPECIES: MarR family transcriptional regulator [unclassified Paenibacillus]SDE36609.1 DNA-binding transcriptional regulator, MarR family [Paenibacillus sp. cl123]SFW64765.1 DNA-binding transcriptional regulator, MarR family [Paenibacillus sp. UNCCL117]